MLNISVIGTFMNMFPLYRGADGGTSCSDGFRWISRIGSDSGKSWDLSRVSGKCSAHTLRKLYSKVYNFFKVGFQEKSKLYWAQAWNLKTVLRIRIHNIFHGYGSRSRSEPTVAHFHHPSPPPSH